MKRTTPHLVICLSNDRRILQNWKRAIGSNYESDFVGVKSILIGDQSLDDLQRRLMAFVEGDQRIYLAIDSDLKISDCQDWGDLLLWSAQHAIPLSRTFFLCLGGAKSRLKQIIALRPPLSARKILPLMQAVLVV